MTDLSIENNVNRLCGKVMKLSGNLFTVDTADSRNGSSTTGPYTIQCGQNLRFWSGGGIYLKATKGSAKIQIDPNNIFEDSSDPIIPPADQTLPALYINSTTDKLFYWDNVLLIWKPATSKCIEDTDGNTYVCAIDDDKVIIGANNGLNVYADNQLIAGTLMPSDGAGVRMMFAPGIDGAFRAGKVESTQWDTVNVGKGSVAFGLNTIASGDGSLAFGNVLNNGKISSIGKGSFSGGYVAEGNISGNGILSSVGDGSFSGGFIIDNGIIESQVSGSYSFGYSEESGIITTNGYGSYAIGYTIADSEIVAFRDGSFASGYSNKGSSIHATGIGSFSNGYSKENSSINSFADGSNAFGYSIERGSIKTSGYGSTATGYASTNGEIEANGDGSFACGSATNGLISAFGGGSFAGGIVKEVEEINLANGEASFAFGRDVSTFGDYSMIIGKYGSSQTSYAGSDGVPSGSSMISTIGCFQIAGGGSLTAKSISVVIGTETFAGSQDGSTGGGIADFWYTSGADYAEYFEWNDGNPNGEDRTGYFTTLKDDKLVIAIDNEDVIGVSTSTSGTSGIIADSAELHWNNVNLTDNFGRIKTKMSCKTEIENIIKKYIKQNKEQLTELQLTELQLTKLQTLLDTSANTSLDNEELKQETISLLSQFHTNSPSSSSSSSNNISTLSNNTLNVIKKIKETPILKYSIPNPNYDANKKYIPRSARKEWIPVGLLGKLFVRDDGTCKVGKKCDCKNGIAVNGSKWRVMNRVDETTVRILLI